MVGSMPFLVHNLLCEDRPNPRLGPENKMYTHDTADDNEKDTIYFLIKIKEIKNK